jgi:hypothetical protein
VDGRPEEEPPVTRDLIHDGLISSPRFIFIEPNATARILDQSLGVAYTGAKRRL